MNNLCNICPRNCNVDREKSFGFCVASDKLKVSKVMLHYFEEPIISGTTIFKNEAPKGSGAIFFSNCSLKCVYCQNSDISCGGHGKEISIQTLADIFKQLENAGALNINLVSPSHFTLQIVEALKIYKPNIPIIWNTSGYEKPETIEMLKDYVDIYLTDLKYFDENLSLKYSGAKNYFEFANKSILKMRENQPADVICDGVMKKGLIVRHLVLPNYTNDSIKIINWIYENLGNNTILSLMSQYVPVAGAKKFPEINRKITPLEYKILVNLLNKLKFDNAFIQEHGSADSCYTPDFLCKKSDFKY